MSGTEITYPPVDKLKPVLDGVWIVDSGPHQLMGVSMPVRMTVLRLRSGELILYSPTRLTPDLALEIERCGSIAHLVAPNLAHWSYIAKWQERYPQATLWAAPGLRERPQVQKSGLRIDQELGGAAPAQWGDEIELVAVPGAAGFTEICLFHKPSETLVLTDLIVNVEEDKLQPLVRMAARLVGSTAPQGKAPVYLRMAVNAKREAAARAAERLVALKPQRVIFSHGRWFESDGTAKLRQSLRWLLK